MRDLNSSVVLTVFVRDRHGWYFAAEEITKLLPTDTLLEIYLKTVVAGLEIGADLSVVCLVRGDEGISIQHLRARVLEVALKLGCILRVTDGNPAFHRSPPDFRIAPGENEPACGKTLVEFAI